MLSLHLQAPPSFPVTFSPSKLKPYAQRARAMTRIFCSTSQGVVEHIVLVKVKEEAEPTKVNAMVNAMNSLATLDGVMHLTVGPLLRSGPTTSGLSFTHMLHSRYGSKEALGAYNKHPRHVDAVRGFLFPVSEDIMVVDWITGEANLPRPVKDSGLRVSCLKLKEKSNNYDEVKDEVLRGVRGIKHGDGGVGELSCGENFSPERGKGFVVAWLELFPGRKEMESVDLDQGLVKVMEHVEDVVVVDYVVP